MRMSEKCRNNNHNNNSDNPLTSRRTDGGKKAREIGPANQDYDEMEAQTDKVG